MKSLITMVIGLCLTFSAIAQGTLAWKNTVAPSTPIYEVDGTTPLLGEYVYVVDLFYGPVGADPSTFTSLGLATPFGTGADAGYFDAGEVAIPGFAPGSQVQIQARAWRTSDAASWLAAYSTPASHLSFVGFSPVPVITVTLGGVGSPPSAPASFEGYLISHSLAIRHLGVPEPSTVLIGVGGLACLVFLRRRKA